MTDSWRTPQDLFDILNEEFNFDIDLAATEDNAKCERYCKDYLQEIIGYTFDDKVTEKELLFNLIECAWMNPPFSNPKLFIEKAWHDSQWCKIVCLVKCDPSTKWWSTFWNYEISYKTLKCDYCEGTGEWEVLDDGDNLICSMCYGNGVSHIEIPIGPKLGCDVRFFSKRIKFDPPKQWVDSGEVWKIGNKWVQGCKDSSCTEYSKYHELNTCPNCGNKGYKEFSGPTFPCALIIMDRRNV